LKPRTRVNRPRFYYESGWVQISSLPLGLRTEHITLGSAYSDTAAVTSCSRQSQYDFCEVVNCNKLNEVISVSSSSYSARTALGIGMRLNELGLTFFIQRF